MGIFNDVYIRLNSYKRKGKNVEPIYEHPFMLNAMNRAATPIANTGSHEVGHLFGLTHENDSGTIMDGGNNTDFNKDLNFSEKSKEKLKEYFGNPYAF